MAAIRAIRNATARRVTAAGGITTQDEIDYLDSIGVDAVVGMAIYTGKLDLPTSRTADPPSPRLRRAGRSTWHVAQGTSAEAGNWELG